MHPKIVSRSKLVAALSTRRAAGERIVFTNGCFDILHVGHARYLEQAKALGDLLVVGLNSDESVRQLKGPARPLVPELERAELLAYLESIDYVCIFGEETPIALIEAIRPHLHVKGGDYCADHLPEATAVRQHGGEVAILPLVEGSSTTNIVQRVVEAYGGGRRKRKDE